MSSSDPGNWEDDNTRSESFALAHSTALAILGACVAAAGLLILVGLVTATCLLEKKHARKADLEQQQLQHDPFESALLNTKNAAFEETPLKQPLKQTFATEAAPVGKWAGGTGTYEQPQAYYMQQQEEQRQQQVYYQLQQQYYNQQQGQASLHFPQPPQPVHTTGAWS